MPADVPPARRHRRQTSSVLEVRRPEQGFRMFHVKHLNSKLGSMFDVEHLLVLDLGPQCGESVAA